MEESQTSREVSFPNNNNTNDRNDDRDDDIFEHQSHSKSVPHNQDATATQQMTQDAAGDDESAVIDADVAAALSSTDRTVLRHALSQVSEAQIVHYLRTGMAKLEASFEEERQDLARIREQMKALRDTQTAQLRQLEEWRGKINAVESLLFPEKKQTVLTALRILQQQQQEKGDSNQEALLTDQNKTEGDRRLIEEMTGHDGPLRPLTPVDTPHAVHPAKLKAVIELGPDGPISGDLIDLLRRRFDDICGFDTIAVL
ncbi:unnamed protein product [Sympodiomycopsis kandeliae]